MPVEYDILGGFVHESAIKEFTDLEAAITKAAKAADTLLGAQKQLSQGKDYSAAANKLAESTKRQQILDEKLAEVKAKNAAAQAARDEKELASLIRKEAAEKQRLATADTWINRQKAKYEAEFKVLQLEEKQFELMLKAEQKEAEKAAKDASRLAQKEARESAAMSKQEQREAVQAAKQEERTNIRIARETAAAARLANSQANAAFKASPEGVAQTVGNQAQAQVMKLNAIVASEYATSLQKIQAQMKLLEIEMQGKFNPALQEQSEEFRNLNSQHAKLNQESQRTARATGVMGRSMNSMYGSTFQLTQVMRELPNFAIDARIGFMALSNNLPMLADSFKMLKQQIIDTEGAAGAGRKTWAAFGKSLLSLNTIMIVASTLLVLYGDDIVNFVEKIFKGEKSVDAFRNALLGLDTAQHNMYKTMKDGGGVLKTTVESIDRMKSSLENSKGNTKESKYYLDEYNKTLGVTFGKATDVDGALKLITANQEDYISAMKNMAFANAFFDKSAEDVVKRVEIALKSKNQIVNEAGKDSKAMYTDLTILNKALDEAKTKGSASFNLKGSGGFLGGSTVTDASATDVEDMIKNQQDKINKIESTERGKQYKAVDDHQKAMLGLAQKYAKKSSDMYDKNGWGFPADDPKGDKAKKTFTEINVLRVMYDKQHADLVEKAAQLEQDISKSNLDGELNSYDKRTAAAELYYKIISELSEKDRNIAIANENAKMAKEKESLRIKHENNVNKFGAGSAEAAKSASDLAEGNNVLFLNNADARQKIIDDFTKKELDAARKKQSDLRKINEDMYADEVYLLEQAKKKEAAALGISSTKQKAKTGAKTTSELINSKLGGSSDNKLQEIEDDRNAKNEQLAVDRKYIEDELALKNISGEKKKELQRKWDENLASAVQNDREANTQNEIELAQMAEDAKASIISDSIDTLKSLWDSYYQYQQDKIDETLKKQTAVNEESVKQYQDETDAGMHTAKQMSDYKDRIAAYQASQDDAAAEKKKQLEKEQFLTKQAFAVGEVWINYAINVAKAGVNAVAQGWLLGSAIASTALIAAQTIPAFAEGGTMGKDGKAWIGDGGKNELVMTPTGEWYVSPKVPTVVDMKAGTKIFPDINKLDLNSFLAMAQVRPSMLKTDNLEKEIRGLRSDVRNQKQGNFYGMPLIRQLNNSDRYSARRRGLMN